MRLWCEYIVSAGRLQLITCIRILASGYIIKYHIEDTSLIWPWQRLNLWVHCTRKFLRVQQWASQPAYHAGTWRAEKGNAQHSSSPRAHFHCSFVPTWTEPSAMGQVLIFAFIHAYFYSSEIRGGSVPLSLFMMLDVLCKRMRSWIRYWTCPTSQLSRT